MAHARQGRGKSGSVAEGVGHPHRVDTDDGAIPGALRLFVRNRVLELTGLALLGAMLIVALSLASWSVDDPSFNNAVDAIPRNWLGRPGAIIADELMQLFGLGVLVLIV